MENLSGIIISGVVSSIIASFVFYLLMVVIKPRFEISPDICKSAGNDGKTYYRIKIVNRTHSMITDVKYSLGYCHIKPDELKEFFPIEPCKNEMQYVARYSKKNTDYAVRIAYDFDEEKFELSNDDYFIFTFQAVHPFSNSIRMKQKIYKKENIKEGIFSMGESMKILYTET